MIQGNNPIAFFSRKLTEIQQHYSVTKIELLAIVKTLKEFKKMLWRQMLKVVTDHKELIQPLDQWRLLLALQMNC